MYQQFSPEQSSMERAEIGQKIEPLKAVYCYYFPEVRKIISEVAANYPHETFLQSINPGLDDFHKPVIETYIKHSADQLPGLKSFPYQYVTNGASEGIFHTLSRIAAFEKEKPLYVLQGEYEGYAGYGNNLGLRFHEISEGEKFQEQKPGIFFLSNPSARDGNIIGDEVVEEIANAGHEIVYDATYVGLTDPHRFMIDHPSIRSVLVSLSKPFGLYYYRVGFAFSRTEMLTLEVNKWFKNIFSLTVAGEVLKKIGCSELALKYRPSQLEAVSKLNDDHDLWAMQSDVILLAKMKGFGLSEKKLEEIKKFDRTSNYRFCLTPYFLNEERGFV